MSPDRNRLAISLRLTTLVLAASLAACSSTGDTTPEPVARTSTAPSGSTSLDPSAASSSSAAQASSSQPVVERVSEPVPLAEGHPDKYVVQEGDTLWDIASVFLRDPWYWPEVWYVNPQVEDPHLIYPGDVLSLVYIDGQQRIVNERISAYRLAPQARISALDEAVHSIPYEDIVAFLSKGLVLEKNQADDLPYILAVRGDNLIGAAGNEVYVRGGQASPSGTRYSVIHVGDELVDPDDGKVLGYLGIYVGEGSLSRGGDPATVALHETTREALAGDRLLPETIDIPLNFFPKPPDIAIDGRIISVVGGVTQIGQYQVIVLNRGARNGLAPGDVLTVYRHGEEVRDRFSSAFRGEKVKLPDEEAGTAMIFKVYDRISYALIMEATDAIHIYDAVRNPN